MTQLLSVTMRDSLSISPAFVAQAKGAMASLDLTRQKLADKTGVSRTSVDKFLSSQRIDRRNFVRFCEVLGMDWEQVAESNTEKLIEDIRQQVKADIHDRCGTMRVLDMEQPMSIDDIYTSVNILEKLSGRRRLGIEELRQKSNFEDFDRILLRQVRHERVPGLEAVERYNKLIVLGKPGAGKTTFVKRLASLCNQGEFKSHCVPIFVTLKEFAEVKGQTRLRTYIENQWNACSIKRSEALTTVLEKGHAFILLDGLDEVQETDNDQLLQEIESFTHRFRNCQFVMTCRIAAREYIFETFTEVEVADFDLTQIENFATKWFLEKKVPEKAKIFIKRLKNNIPIQDLATNPLLLTLLCLVFSEAADFPHNRSELYKEGLDILLKKWDATRNIERDQIYNKLSIKRKVDLLSQIGFKTFDKEEYFFKKNILELNIIDYIRNLPRANEDIDALQLDGEAILKSIEAQHGLLVERARGIYSFSHLTFQEYFTAKKITSPSSHIYSSLSFLASHITDNRYREVFLLAFEMLPEADELLKLMKKNIDQLIINDQDLQDILTWINRKHLSVNVSYKPAAVRAFYFILSICRDLKIPLFSALDIAHLLDINILNITQDFDLDREFDYALEKGIIRKLEIEFSLDFDLQRSLDLVFEIVLFYKQDSEKNSIKDSTTRKTQAYTSEKFISSITPPLVLALDRAIKKAGKTDHNLKLVLEEIKNKFLEINSKRNPIEWWGKKGESCAANLHSIMTKYRDIGHLWKFNNLDNLKKYYEANLLLVECLNSDSYITKSTRQEIENTLLLPISEMKKE